MTPWYDAYPSPPYRLSWRKVAVLAAVLVLLAGAAWAQAATLYVYACQDGRCRTIPVSVESCTAGGQAAMAQWLADHPAFEVKAWYCDAGGVPA